jgi:hypothetical protein
MMKLSKGQWTTEEDGDEEKKSRAKAGRKAAIA